MSDPGWYPNPDPEQSGSERYFDGEQWTEQYRPVPQPAPEPAQEPAPAPAERASDREMAVPRTYQNAVKPVRSGTVWGSGASLPPVSRVSGGRSWGFPALIVLILLLLTGAGYLLLSGNEIPAAAPDTPPTSAAPAPSGSGSTSSITARPGASEGAFTTQRVLAERYLLELQRGDVAAAQRIYPNQLDDPAEVAARAAEFRNRIITFTGCTPAAGNPELASCVYEVSSPAGERPQRAPLAVQLLVDATSIVGYTALPGGGSFS